jgi:hypothetical protein
MNFEEDATKVPRSYSEVKFTPISPISRGRMEVRRRRWCDDDDDDDDDNDLQYVLHLAVVDIAKVEAQSPLVFLDTATNPHDSVQTVRMMSTGKSCRWQLDLQAAISIMARGGPKTAK